MTKKKKTHEVGGTMSSQQFLASVTNCVQAYQANPLDGSTLAEIRALRSRVARFWVSADVQTLKNFYLGVPGKALQSLLVCDIQNQPLTPDEEREIREWDENISSCSQEAGTIRYVMAAMLYQSADLMPKEILELTVPQWFRGSLVPFLLRAKSFYTETGDVERFYRYMDVLVKYFHDHIHSQKNVDTSKDNNEVRDFATLFTQYANFIPLYFGYSDLKTMMIRRAEIIEQTLLNAGYQLNQMPAVDAVRRDRIRLGILNAHYKPQTETYATLPVFEHIDRSRYEVILFGAEIGGHDLERYCQSRADKLIGLPRGIDDQIRVIRDANIDVLFFGTNITAVSNSVALLASSRMAPVQVTSICSPVTTGMKNIDYYIAGDLTVSAENDQQHYTERLVTIPGSGLCFSYAAESETPTIQPSRNSMGIPEEAIIYVSGANFYKLTPDVRETWVKIIAEVPGSLLVLYPFNPYWSRSYQAVLLFTQMQALFAKYGIDNKRLIILKPFPQRSDIKEVLKLCDIYLDAYPYGGATSIIDPLQVGLPPVVVHGDYLRFRQASALLRELGVPELITTDEAGYRELAVSLGRSRELRQMRRSRIVEKMRDNPPFLDSRLYSEQIGRIVANLYDKHCNQAAGGQITE